MDVIVYLNAIIEGAARTEITPNEAKLALFKIETTELAVAALRNFALHPKNPETFAHAARYLALYDAQLAARQHAAALVAAPTVGAQPVAAATSEPNQDVSDLV